jgi:hypothetical protein
MSDFYTDFLHQPDSIAGGRDRTFAHAAVFGKHLAWDDHWLLGHRVGETIVGRLLSTNVGHSAENLLWWVTFFLGQLRPAVPVLYFFRKDTAVVDAIGGLPPLLISAACASPTARCIRLVECPTAPRRTRRHLRTKSPPLRAFPTRAFSRLTTRSKTSCRSLAHRRV